MPWMQIDMHTPKELVTLSTFGNQLCKNYEIKTIMDEDNQNAIENILDLILIYFVFSCCRAVDGNKIRFISKNDFAPFWQHKSQLQHL